MIFIDSRDLIGKKINKLTVLSIDESRPHGKGKEYFYICKCECGKICSKSRHALRNGVYSCGCSTSKFYDIKGKRYGRLRVIEEAGRKHKEIVWKCICDCGNEVFIISSSLRNGVSRSCGCLHKDRLKEKTKNSLLKKFPKLYCKWTNMKTRCYNKKYYLFKSYGGKGITVCNEWLGKDGFKNFVKWAVKNNYSENSGLSIDRIDNSKGYISSNCRFVTMEKQQNNRTNNKIIKFENEVYTLSQWCKKYGICYRSAQRLFAESKTAEQVYKRLSK